MQTEHGFLKLDFGARKAEQFVNSTKIENYNTYVATNYIRYLALTVYRTLDMFSYINTQSTTPKALADDKRHSAPFLL